MNAQRIEGAVTLVTGANRGIGRALTEALLTRGARKVYAAARNRVPELRPPCACGSTMNVVSQRKKGARRPASRSTRP